MNTENTMTSNVPQVNTDINTSDVLYEKLRAAIRNKIKTLIDEDAAFVKTDRVIPEPGKLFRGLLQENDRQQYKCVACSLFFKDFGKLGYVTEQGSVRNVLAEVYNEALDTDFPVKTETIEPFSFNTSLTNEHDGKWGHFFAFTPEEIEELKKDYTFDFSNSMTVAACVYNRDTDIQRFRQFIADVESKVMNPVAFGVVRRFLEFKENAPKRKLDQRQAAALMNKKSHQFLKHLTSTAAWSFLISPLHTEMYEDFNDLIEGFNEITAPDVYKHKKREAEEQNFRQMQTMLHKLNCQDILERRWAEVSEVNPLWVRKEEVSDSAPDDSVSLMDKMVNSKLMKSEPKTDYKFNPDTVRDISMKSVEGCIEKAKDFKIIGHRQYIGVFSAPVKSGDYHEILKCGEDGIYPIFYTEPFMLDKPIHDVSAVIFRNISDEPPLFVSDSAVQLFKSKQMHKLGSQVIGPVIKSEFNGISRPLAELSTKVELQDSPSGTNHAGVIPLCKGSVIAILDENDIWKTYRITSVE